MRRRELAVGVIVAGRMPYVALTFDDGPGAYTGALLGKLRRAHARATFFVVGDRLRDWPHLAPAEQQLGDVGDHTWDHARLLSLPRRAARWEMAAPRRAITE